tara:strand:- start:467 stop:712 length:246 start_codon:yes stop_codon:yes gene_type:complete
MSSEVHKYIEKSLNKKQHLFDAQVLNFPSDKKVESLKHLKENDYNFWKINDKSNEDQLKAVTGICFMFCALMIMGLYSNLL